MKRFSQQLWLAFSFFSMMILGFTDNLRGPLFFDILQDFKLSDLEGAWFYSATASTGFFASVAAAYILKKQHVLQLLVLAVVTMAVALFGMGLLKNYYLFLMAAGGLGVALGFLSIAQNSSISYLTTLKTQSRVYSGLHSMYGLSSFLAPLAVGWGLGNGWTWRDFFIYTGMVVLVFTIITLVSPFPKWAQDYKKTPPPEKNSFRELGLVSVYMALAAAFYVIAEILVGSRLSLYTIREMGLSTQEASRYVTGFYLGMLVGRLGGVVFKWPGHYRFQLYASLGLSFLTIAAGLYHNPWWFVAAGLAMSPFYPVIMVYLSDVYQKRIGVMMSLTIAIQSLAIVFMHQIVGFVSNFSGIKIAFHLGFAFLILSALFLLLGEAKRKTL